MKCRLPACQRRETGEQKGGEPISTPPDGTAVQQLASAVRHHADEVRLPISARTSRACTTFSKTSPMVAPDIFAESHKYMLLAMDRRRRYPFGVSCFIRWQDLVARSASLEFIPSCTSLDRRSRCAISWRISAAPSKSTFCS